MFRLTGGIIVQKPGVAALSPTSLDEMVEISRGVEIVFADQRSDNKDIPNVVPGICVNVEIEDSHKNLTKTCKITLPKKGIFDPATLPQGPSNLFIAGTRIQAIMGYDDINEEAFSGYISRVLFNTPVVVECEDEMYILKKTPIKFPVTKGDKSNFTKGVTTMKLSKFITDVVLKEANKINTGIEYTLKLLGGSGDFNINIIRFDCSAAQVLDKLKDTFPGLYAYFVGTELNVGFLNDASITRIIEINLEAEAIDYKNLIYQTEDEVKLQVRATSINVQTMKRVEVTVGDDGGAHRDIFTTKNLTKDELKKWAEKRLLQNKYTGYYGNFTTFGGNTIGDGKNKFINPGDAVQIMSNDYPDRNGTYLVNGVEREFGIGGYRQKVELGVQIGFQAKNKIS